MNRWWYSLLLASCLGADPLQRGLAYLKLGEAERGVVEIREALDKNPSDKALQEVYIRLLAASGRESESIEAYKRYEKKWERQEERREVLEEVCWGVIRKGFHSSLLLARIYSLVGALFTQDAYAVDLMHRALMDSNWMVRSLAVELSTHLMDGRLQDKVVDLLQNDPVGEVRLEAIVSVGKMRLRVAEPILGRMLKGSLDAQEQALVIQSLAAIKEKPRMQEIDALAGSDRAGLRRLACALAEENQSVAPIGCLLKLVEDGNSEVKIQALSSLALLRQKGFDEELVWEKTRACLTDGDFRVAITAAYLATLLQKEEAKERLKKWCSFEQEEVRRFAAAALSSTGQFATKEMVQVLQTSTDPYVQVHMAAALIGQRVYVSRASEHLFDFLSTQDTLLMIDSQSHPLFDMVVPTKLRHVAHGNPVDSPEAMDIRVRLSMLRMLAIVGYPQTLSLLKQFLREKNFGTTAAVSETLIAEGSGEDIELVETLLYDPELKVRVQAALVLGMWGKGQASVTVLQEAYPQVDRELKIKILEALAHIGAAESVPFLLDKMQDSYQVIRVIGAAALITCLNH